MTAFWWVAMMIILSLREPSAEEGTPHLSYAILGLAGKGFHRSYPDNCVPRTSRHGWDADTEMDHGRLRNRGPHSPKRFQRGPRLSICYILETGTAQ